MTKFSDLPDNLKRCYVLLKFTDPSIVITTDGTSLFYDSSYLNTMLAVQLCNIVFGVIIQTSKHSPSVTSKVEAEVHAGSVHGLSDKETRLCVYLHLLNRPHWVIFDDDDICAYIGNTEPMDARVMKDCLLSLVGKDESSSSILFRFNESPTNYVENLSDYVSVSASADGKFDTY